MFCKKDINRNAYISIVLVLLMVFLVSGCSSKEKSNKETDRQETSVAESAVRTSEEVKDEFPVNLSVYEAERVSSNADGQFRFNLPAGTYTAQIEADGYMTLYQTV